MIAKVIRNNPIPSNCYIITDDDNGSSILIDPGYSKPDPFFLDFIAEMMPCEFIILTHEHFDHIWSLNFIKEKYNIPVICSEDCGKSIIDKKRNLSLFYDQVGFEAYPADIVFKDRLDMKWYDRKIEFFRTPGHSEGSICIKIDNMIFTGDTLIKDKKTVIKFPGSSKPDLLKSLKLIEERSDSGTIFYPGHGESFKYLNYDFKKCI